GQVDQLGIAIGGAIIVVRHVVIQAGGVAPDGVLCGGQASEHHSHVRFILHDGSTRTLHRVSNQMKPRVHMLVVTYDVPEIPEVKVRNRVITLERWMPQRLYIPTLYAKKVKEEPLPVKP